MKDKKAQTNIGKIWVVISLLVLVSIVGSYLAITGFATQGQDIVSVGVLTPISGPGSFYGENIIDGIECAQEVINNQDRINGKKIELVIEDSQCDGKTALSGAEKLIGIDDVIGIVGAACSVAVIPMGTLAQSTNTPVIASAASNPSITDNPYLFRVNPNDLAQSQAVADYIKENLDLKSVGILALNDEYGRGLVEEFKKRYTSFGGKIKTTEYFAADDKDFKSQIMKLSNSDFEILFIIAAPAQHPIIAKQIRELDKNWITIAEFNFATVPSEAKNSAMKGTIYPTSIFNKDATKNAQRLYQCMQSKGKETDVLNAWGFDALYVLSEAASKCKPVSGECVRNNLIGLEYDGAYGDNVIDSNQEIKNLNFVFLVSD